MGSVEGSVRGRGKGVWIVCGCEERCVRDVRYVCVRVFVRGDEFDADL